MAAKVFRWLGTFGKFVDPRLLFHRIVRRTCACVRTKYEATDGFPYNAKRMSCPQKLQNPRTTMIL